MSETIKTILEAETGNFRSEFARARSTIDQFHSRMATIGGAVAGSAIFTGLVSGFNSIRNSIDVLNDQAARLEMPVEEMQQLNAVATMAGASVEALAKAHNKTQLNALEAAAGNEALAKEFLALGINAKDFLNLSATDRILALSNGFNTASDQGAAFSAIFKVMGKGAADLIPLLRDGAAGVEEISRKLKVLGGDDVAAVAKLNDQIDLLSANISTDLSKAFVSLRPQIEWVVKKIAGAAEGMSVFFDPAKGVGSQGGVFGGAAIIREMDLMKAKIEEINANPAKWYQGPMRQKKELQESVEALAVLQGRYAGLSDESRAYAEQLVEIDRLRKSGLSGEGLDRAAQALQARTAETLRSIEAEKALGTASADTAEQMERQATVAAATAQAVANLKEKVARRIIDAQSPEKRQEVAKSDLSGILTRENASSISEISNRVNTATNPEDQQRALKALDEWMDRQQDLKKANEELVAAAKAQADANESASEKSRAAAEKYRNTLDGIQAQQDQEREKARDQATARANYSGSIRAIQLELAGRKDLADQLRQQMDLQGQVGDFAKAHGVSEEEALKLLRVRLSGEERLKKLREGLQNNPPTQTGGRPASGGVRRGSIYIKDSALNDEGGARFQGVGARKIGLNGEARFQGIGARRIGLQNFELNRRGAERRAINNARPQGDDSAKTLQKSLNIQEELLKVWQKLNTV
jgi:hypothetical protein